MPRVLHLSAVTVDMGSGLVRQGAQQLTLGALELSLLETLVRRSPEVVTRDDLRREVWRSTADITTRAVDQAVRRLRGKLGEPGRAPRHIIGVYGEGYRFVPLESDAASPDAPVEEPTRGNLLPGVSSFVGRSDELAWLREGLQQHPAVVVLGPPGVGKSRLARHGGWSWRTEYPHGLWVLDLDSVPSDADAIARLEALWDIPSPDAALDAAARLDAVLGSFGATPRALLLIDNAEDAPGFAGRLASAVTASTPQLRLIITSRTPIPGDLPTRRLEGLHPSHGAQLLRDRASAFVPEVAGDEAHIDELVKLLDGSPLGVELAAARLRLLNPEEMVRRMRAGRRVLGANPTGAARHATIDAAILSSWEDLPPAPRAALKALSAFGGTLSNTAAEHILAESVPDEDALGLLDTLLDRSLIMLSGTRPQRLLVYRCVREFVAGLDTPARAEEHRLAIAQSLGRWGGATVHELMGPDQDRVAAALALDLPFVEQAAVWTLERDAASAVALLQMITEYSWLTGLVESAKRLTALALTREVANPLAALDLRLIRAAILVLDLQHAEAEELLHATDYGPQHVWRRCVSAFLVANCQSIRSPQAALDTIDGALTGMDLDRLQMRVVQARLLLLRARLRTLLTDADTALEDLRAARRAWNRIGSRSGEGSSYIYQGMFEYNLRRGAEAGRSLSRALELLDRPGGHRQRYLARIILANVHHDEGSLDRALATLGPPPSPHEHADLATLHYYNRGLAHLGLGDHAQAEQDVEALHASLAEDAHPFYAAHAAALDARVALAVGDRRRVVRACARSRGHVGEGALRTVAPLALVPLMMIAAETGATVRAEALLGHVETILHEASHRRVQTGLIPLRAALAFAKARTAPATEATALRRDARQLLRAAKVAKNVHESPAAACAEYRLFAGALDRSVDATGALRVGVPSALDDDVEAELDAWNAALA